MTMETRYVFHVDSAWYKQVIAIAVLTPVLSPWQQWLRCRRHRPSVLSCVSKVVAQVLHVHALTRGCHRNVFNRNVALGLYSVLGSDLKVP